MNFTLNCQGKLVNIAIPQIMGIVNITPDSFFEQSRVTNSNAIVNKVRQMETDGANIIDIGAQSTNPNSIKISAEEEWQRIAPILPILLKEFPNLIFSIDTYYSVVAEKAINQGVHIVNDVSGGEMDIDMIATVAKYKVPYICMHLQGTPQTMQLNPQYNDVVVDVLDYFLTKKTQLLTAGINDIIFDVGFGFGKTIEQNFKLLKDLSVFEKTLSIPLLSGLSRKSMIYKTLGTTPEKALNGTTALHMIALEKGASILRVHDVLEAKECITLWNAINN